MNIAKHIMIQTFFISIGLFYYCLNDIDLRQIAFKALILSYLSMLVVCQIDRERMIAEQEVATAYDNQPKRIKTD